MKFTIDAVVLWPRFQGMEPRVIPFVEGKINIIHGLSGTGKSSIVHIIDYVLGAKKCQIPIGIIRDTVEWFGLKIRILDATHIVARRTPGSSQASSDFFMLVSEEGDIPETVTRTHTQSQYQAAFNAMVRVSDLPHSDDEEPSNFDRRSTYRDMAAFNFLPQHIVANPNTLFFKTDSFAHKERLTRAMPYALGMVDANYVMNARRREEAQREQDKLRKLMDVHAAAKASHHADVDQLFDRCVQLGLLSNANASMNAEKVMQLKRILSATHEGRLEQTLLEPQRLHISQKLKEVIEAVGKQQGVVDELDTQIDGFSHLARTSQRFVAAIDTEKSHVIGLEWLKESVADGGHCVACGSFTNALPVVIENLETRVNKVTRISDALKDNPVVDQQLAVLKRKRAKEERELSSLLKERNRLIQDDERTRDAIGQIYFVAGEISRLVKQLDGSTADENLLKRLAELDKIIRDYSDAMSATHLAEQERKVDRQLTPMIEEYADKFGLNGTPDSRILLDRKELTLRFDSDDRRDFLWEIGSGANWMGYHIATFLGIHEYLSREENRNLPPFSFIVIDQPSQVYFPSNSGGFNALDDGFEAISKARPADVIATRRIFEVLSEGLKRAGHFVQIIVLEHAGPDIWGEVEHTVEVEAWERRGDGLIPAHWINAA
ncbi:MULTISPECIES: DUF3732 domain-containing protein [unclassified Pseudomonas]|uniref:DUF3732 domain-containing protein n=1 Tax=unclassified Pseudomonas TaxID=196821 RepID=UPI000D3BC51B|nr:MULTISPECIES: DUF3732 domain-containing protein [unclassified Pseudomonas]RAU45533.1 DUF3732 domain-containing protein [Pseudomonas sp. RIT 409]RAU53084.1 DUF3732 domain-containing protein [Pseudomonas sp. RIT 412]